MTKRKWGESFLKSGLPLEHLTLVTLKTLNFNCRPGIEYKRANESGEMVWFEIDMDAEYWGRINKDTFLRFLVECKYHDESRFWFFLPCEAHRWQFNERVYNCAPLQTLSKPKSSGALELAPLSYKGIVVSQDGTKQENAVKKAVEQLARGFVPWSLSMMFEYSLDIAKRNTPVCNALVPMIVTNADIYRLKPEVTDLRLIRKATTPEDVGDLLPWTWCYHDPCREAQAENRHTIENHISTYKELFARFPKARIRLKLWDTRPNWFLVVNVDNLSKTVETICKHFSSMKTCTSRTALSKQRKVRPI